MLDKDITLTLRTRSNWKNEQTRKTKKCIDEELCQSGKKKRQLQTIAEELIYDVNALAKEAEMKNSPSLLVKSNALAQKSGAGKEESY